MHDIIASTTETATYFVVYVSYSFMPFDLCHTSACCTFRTIRFLVYRQLLGIMAAGAQRSARYCCRVRTTAFLDDGWSPEDHLDA